MNNYFNMANKKIITLIKELSSDADNLIKDLKDDEEKSKVSLLLLYYKIVLQGCIRFGNEANNYVKMLKDCSIDESDVAMILDKYCDKPVEDIGENDIALDENPPVDIDVEEIYSENDIVLDENPPVDIDVEDISNDNDIVFDENPPININVSEISDIDINNIFPKDGKHQVDIIKNENYSNQDIVLNENLPIDIDVEDISNSKDIVLDENPPIDIDVENVTDIGEIDLPKPNGLHNSESKSIDSAITSQLNIKDNSTNGSLPLFGDLTFSVDEITDIEDFDANNFIKQAEAERKAKKDRKKKKNKVN